MRNGIAIVESVADEVAAEVRAAASALREAEVQEGKSLERAAQAHDRASRAKEATAQRRLDLGRALLKARRQWPERGPRAKGWGDLLRREGISESTARDLMQLAGYVGEISAPSDHGAEISGDIPTREEVRGARRGERDANDDEPAEPDTSGDVEVISPGAAIDIRLGDWHVVLADVGVVDALIVDPPYGAQTHEAVTTRDDGSIPTGLTPTYDAWTHLDVEMFVAEWSSRCRGWMVALTSDDLIPAWRAAYRAHDRYDFAPVPCVIRGMSVRIQGDGPSSWAVYAMVSRPRNLAKWGTLPGAHVGPSQPGAKSGRGKPDWLMDELVEAYTRAGDLVCDPLAGYGTTLRSALRLGRRAVGAEIDEDARREAIIRWRADQQARAAAGGAGGAGG